MTGGNGMIWIERSRCSPDLMTPPRSDSRTRWHRDDGVVLVLEVGVAGKVGMVHVLNGVVGPWCTNTLKLPLVYSID